MNKNKIILDLCGGTGAWSKPYSDNGYDVRIINLPEYDVRLYPTKISNKSRYPREFESIEDIDNVYGILAAPPCTVFSGSGARHKRSDIDMIEGISIIDACIRLIYVLKPKFWALENPVGKLRKWLGPPVMSFHPYEFGDSYTKKTLLWGEFNIPKKCPVGPTEGTKMGKILWNYPTAEDRKRERSITPSGFAKAFYRANE